MRIKKGVSLICLVLFIVVGVSAREKQEKIGKYSWYTEQNTMVEMAEVSKKANKPILAVFSATWCGPCQSVKKRVFKTDEFSKVIDEVVVMYIEQTDPKGKEYCKTYKVRSWPTFKIFSKNGTMLDTGRPKRTVDGFVEWIKDVKAGNNFHQLSKALEKNPNDREALVKITGKMNYSEKKKKIEYLRKAIKLNPDFNDETSQLAYEKLAAMLLSGIPHKDKKKKADYIAENGPLFNKIVAAYYPAKAKHNFEGSYGHNQVIRWYAEAKEYKKALSYFDNFLKTKKEKLDILEDIVVVAAAVPAYLGLNQVDKADEWIKKVDERAKSKEKIEDSRGFVYYSSDIIQEVIEYYAKKNKITDAEKYATQLYDMLTTFKQNRLKDYRMQGYAAKYGIHAGKTLVAIDEKLKSAKKSSKASLTTAKAKVLAKIGKKDQAAAVLRSLYNDKEYFKTLKEKQIPSVLNDIAWTMVELEMVDKTCLEIAKKAVELKKSSMIMDTLACVHAKLGNYKEAIKVEKEALAKETSEFSKKEYKEKIKEWQTKVK